MEEEEVELEIVSDVDTKEIEKALEVDKKIEEVGGNRQERERSLDFLKFEVKEIEDAKIKENEDVLLAEEKAKMLAGEKISTNLDFALDELDGTGNLSELISSACSHLLNVSSYDKNIEDLASRLKSCRIELNDIIEEIKNSKNTLNFSQFEFDKIDSRLDKIKSLKKKYGASTEEIFSFLEKTKKQIEEIENSSEILEKLEKEKENLENELKLKCEKLSKMRKEFALELERKVCFQLDELAMKNAKFKIGFEQADVSKTGFEIPKDKASDVRITPPFCSAIFLNFSK